MAHYAQLNDNNEVIQVIVVSNDNAPGEFPESEAPGVAFCKSLFGEDTIWKQTSYNNNFRKRYAGVGYIYSSQYDAFLFPKPYPSWVLNLEELDWIAPVDYPEVEGYFEWDEEAQIWFEVNIDEEL